MNIIFNLQKITANSLKIEQCPEKIKRLELIQILLSDKDCFFKIDVNTACSMISELGFNKNETINIYKELISIRNFV